MAEAPYYKSPDCISEDGVHDIEWIWDGPFAAQCKDCFERFVLVSETVLKNSGTKVRRKGDQPNG